MARAPEARLRVRLRAATVSDVKAIAQIERQSFSDPWSEGSFASLVGSADVFFQVAESPEAHAVAGYVVAWFVAGHGDVANIAVALWARRRGVGATLLDAALSFARTARTHEVYLEVRESNSTARALYASRGFAEVGRRRGYYRRPVEDALVLRLDMAVGRPE